MQECNIDIENNNSNTTVTSPSNSHSKTSVEELMEYFQGHAYYDNVTTTKYINKVILQIQYKV
jgi:hypothetical protein